MVAVANRSFKISSEIPIAPIRVLGVLERLAMADGVTGWSFADDGGVTLFLRPGSPLERMVRRWEPGADELAVALGRTGFILETTVTVHLVKARGANHD